MRNLLLSAALIALPVVVFAAVYSQVASPAPQAQDAAAQSLGDMTPFKTIVTDVQAIAAKGDLKAAETRITDFETAWDDAAGTLRPNDPTAWGNVDTAADAALDALRAGKPDPNEVDATLASLVTELDNPGQAMGGTGSATTVSGIVVTDDGGRPLPCEVMLEKLRKARDASALPAADLGKADDLSVKGTERCNADDDKRADDFFAQGLALLAN